jgi:hypothetical protein
VTTTVVRLPPGVPASFEVYLNGVPQSPGTDYEVRDGCLVFARELKQEGKIGPWRWFLGAWGIGTYREHHSVDVRYEVDGRAAVAEGLRPELAG